MVCSSCGYDNPREHRYCGMCGTPFPHRPLTVPDAQSTLAFSSVPLEIVTVPAIAEVPQTAAPTEPPAQIVEPPPVVASAEVVGPIESPVIEDEVTETVSAPADSIALEPIAPEHSLDEQAASAELAETQPPPGIEVAPAPSEPVVEIEAPEPPFEPEPRAPLPQVEPPVDAPHVVEVAVAPSIIEPRAVAINEPPPAPAAEPEPPRLQVHKPSPPAPHVVLRPTPSRQTYPSTPPEKDTRKPAPPHPSPDSLPITPPPASAGMPTFKEVVDASGPPPISPFDPQAHKHPDEDRELQEYIASFRYTPPAETADELTMRSEVPVIDKQAPAEFHHASFDDDVPPPPEAGPHPTGEEYYAPAGTAERSRFLDISDAHDGKPGPSYAEHGSAPSMLPLDDTARPSRRNFWLWPSIFVLLAIFGGLGFLEGRAQSTHAFRGPVEIVRDEYNRLRQRFAKSAEVPPAASPEPSAADTANQPEAPSKPATAAAPPDASSNASPPPADTSTAPAQAPSTAPASPQPSAPVPDSAATNAGTTKADADTPVEPPLVKPSSKVQPGQQELNKALDASDPAAAAAWLWKSTSRGNPVAPVRLADMYIKGQGVPKSCEQALVLLRSAASKENAPARNRLAALYANGTCVARDRVKAYQLMSSALTADPTSEWAEQNRQELWNKMTPQERAEAQKYR